MRWEGACEQEEVGNAPLGYVPNEVPPKRRLYVYEGEGVEDR